MVCNHDLKVVFIGGGSMAEAIIGGLLSESFRKENIFVSEPWDLNRQKFALMGLQTSVSNADFLGEADVVVLAVKPQTVKDVCCQLKQCMGEKKPLFISIAAGIRTKELKHWLGGPRHTPSIVRAMPNTPALIGEGATGLYAGEEVPPEERELATSLIGSVSQAMEWVHDEKMLDIVTSISGMPRTRSSSNFGLSY